jgi:hypothetical protein
MKMRVQPMIDIKKRKQAHLDSGILEKIKTNSGSYQSLGNREKNR